MPFPNNHACLVDSSLKPIGTVKRKHEGKDFQIRVGQKEMGGTGVRSYLYPTDQWTRAEAAAHCKAHRGKFEAAKSTVQEFRLSDGGPLRFRASLHCMAANEIAAMIPDNVLSEIRRSDPHPHFKAFVVGHEGEARGNLVGVGNVVKRWFKSMIAKLHDKVKAGLQLFHGHGVTNDHDGRISIGKVVGKRLQDIDGRDSVVVACYINPEYRHLPLDVASIEAQVEMEQNEAGEIEIMDVANVSAIALGNSSVEAPGFPGATLLGQLQAFAEERKIGMGYAVPPVRLGYRFIKFTGQSEDHGLAEE